MATSKLQRLFGNMLDQRLPEYRIRENYRPDWLISSDNTRLELDFFIEELKIAFEVQGEQHYKFVPFFHKSEDEFKMRRRHDHEKRTLCYGKGIKFIEIITEFDAQIAIKNVEEKIKKDQPKYFYQENSTWYKPKRKHAPKPGSRSQVKKDRDQWAASRLKRCQQKLELIASGELIPKGGDEKLWKKIVANKGYID